MLYIQRRRGEQEEAAENMRQEFLAAKHKEKANAVADMEKVVNDAMAELQAEIDERTAECEALVFCW